MRIRIHRGTKETGGTCIEFEAAGKRIALDVGLPLNAGDQDHQDLLPLVPGFREEDDRARCCCSTRWRICSRTAVSECPLVSFRTETPRGCVQGVHESPVGRDAGTDTLDDERRGQHQSGHPAPHDVRLGNAPTAACRVFWAATAPSRDRRSGSTRR